MDKLLSNELIIAKDRSIKENMQRYSLILALVAEACESWLQNRWERFDPIVGENACQIRAIKVALLAQSHKLEISSLLKRVASVKSRIDALIESNEVAYQPFFSLIQDHNLDIEVTKEQRFLIDSFLLTIASTIKSSGSEESLLRKDVASPQNLLRFGSSSMVFLKALVAEARHRLSFNSVAFVNEMARSLGDNEGEKMSKTPYVVVTDLLARWCMPCFWSFKNMIDLIRIHQIPVIMRCRLIAKDRQNQEMGVITYFLKPDERGDYQPVLPTTDSKPAIVVEGCMARQAQDFLNRGECESELLKYNVFDLILAFAAAHRQYPEESKDQIVHAMNHPSYESYKKWGDEWGCSINNPSLFFINHVYCSSSSFLALDEDVLLR